MLLFYHFHAIEQDDISNTEDFFWNVQDYINTDLDSCQLRRVSTICLLILELPPIRV